MNENYLSVMMEMQNKLNSNVGVSREKASEMDENTLCLWLEHYNSAQICESGEFWKECSRWWRIRSDDWKEKAAEELIDEIHFLLSKALLLGMSAKDIFDIYCKKNEKNFHRDTWSYKSPEVKDA